MAELEAYIRKVEAEIKDIIEKSAWKELRNLVEVNKSKASRSCETQDDVKRWQGEVRAYRNIFDVMENPGRLIDFIRERNHG